MRVVIFRAKHDVKCLDHRCDARAGGQHADPLHPERVLLLHVERNVLEFDGVADVEGTEVRGHDSGRVGVVNFDLHSNAPRKRT